MQSRILLSSRLFKKDRLTVLTGTESFNQRYKEVEKEYLGIIGDELTRRTDELKRKCEKCTRDCAHRPEDKIECLANLMTIEYILDHN